MLAHLKTDVLLDGRPLETRSKTLVTKTFLFWGFSLQECASRVGKAYTTHQTVRVDFDFDFDFDFDSSKTAIHQTWPRSLVPWYLRIV